jgi:hypothetical protein
MQRVAIVCLVLVIISSAAHGTVTGTPATTKDVCNSASCDIDVIVTEPNGVCQITVTPDELTVLKDNKAKLTWKIDDTGAARKWYFVLGGIKRLTHPDFIDLGPQVGLKKYSVRDDNSVESAQPYPYDVEIWTFSGGGVITCKLDPTIVNKGTGLGG